MLHLQVVPPVAAPPVHEEQAGDGEQHSDQVRGPCMTAAACLGARWKLRTDALHRHDYEDGRRKLALGR